MATNKNLIEMLKSVVDDIALSVVKENQPIIMIDNYNWFKESLSLLAKQVNLCDSCLVLLEANMEQEAYLLARSQFNNLLWIKYLCQDCESDEHIKQFFYQPHICQIKQSKMILELINQYGNKLDEKFLDEEFISEIKRSIEENKKILRQENIDERPMSIAKLAKMDSTLFALYLTIYNEGSKFEHSDISKTKLYRKQIIEGFSEEQVYLMDLSKSDEKVWLDVYRTSLLCIFFSFQAIYNKIQTSEDHLLEDNKYAKAMYKMSDFNRILLKLKACNDMLDSMQPIE